MYPLRGVGNDDDAKGQDLMVPSLLPEFCAELRFSEEWPPMSELLEKYRKARADVEIRTFSRQYEVEFVPLGVFSRLMVRALHVPGASLIIPWRYGFIVELVRLSSSLLGIVSSLLSNKQRSLLYSRTSQRV